MELTLVTDSCQGDFGPGCPGARLVLTLGTLPPRSRRPQRQGGRGVVQAATTALGEVAGDSPAKSVPAANGCKAATTPAALTKRPVGSFASIRSRTAASRSGTSGRRPRTGGTGASTWAFIFRNTDSWAGPANGGRPVNSSYSVQPRA